MSSANKIWVATVKRSYGLATISAVLLTTLTPVSIAGEVIYSYDELGRLDTATYDDGTVVDYGYDANGNRTVLDVDVPVSFVIEDASATEGQPLQFTVKKLGQSMASHSVDYATADGTADQSDYTQTSGTLTFGTQEETKTVSVSTLDDSFYEDDETLYVNLSLATNGAVITDGQAEGVINNNDVSNSPPVAANDYVSFSDLYQVADVHVLDNDTDPNGDQLTITSVTQPGNAWVSINTTPAGTINVVSRRTGMRTFTYTISDGNGGTDTGTVIVDVTGGGGPPL